MTDKMFKFYVVFGIFGIWGTMAHDIIPDIICGIVLVINCIFYLKGEQKEQNDGNRSRRISRITRTDL